MFNPYYLGLAVGDAEIGSSERVELTYNDLPVPQLIQDRLCRQD
jgi:hypothetical protein